MCCTQRGCACRAASCGTGCCLQPFSLQTFSARLFVPPSNPTQGYFAFMSLESLPGSQFWDRLLLLLTDPRKRTLLLEKAHAPYLGELPTVAAATTTAAAAAGMKCRPPSFRLLPIMKCRDCAFPRHCLVHRLSGSFKCSTALPPPLHEMQRRCPSASSPGSPPFRPLQMLHCPSSFSS